MKRYVLAQHEIGTQSHGSAKDLISSYEPGNGIRAVAMFEDGGEFTHFYALESDEPEQLDLHTARVSSGAKSSVSIEPWTDDVALGTFGPAPIPLPHVAPSLIPPYEFLSFLFVELSGPADECGFTVPPLRSAGQAGIIDPDRRVLLIEVGDDDSAVVEADAETLRCAASVVALKQLRTTGSDLVRAAP